MRIKKKLTITKKLAKPRRVKAGEEIVMSLQKGKDAFVVIHQAEENGIIREVTINYEVLIT